MAQEAGGSIPLIHPIFLKNPTDTPQLSWSQNATLINKYNKTMNEIINIENKIYIIRGKKVMLDFDLAKVFGVETRTFNQAVKRNLNRFPDDFMFQLTKSELENLMSQFVISSSWGGIRKLPFAFTEHGAVMAANVLRSDRAVEASVAVVRAFVKMRSILDEYKELKTKIDKLENKYDKQFKIVFEAIKALMETPKTNPKTISGFKK